MRSAVVETLGNLEPAALAQHAPALVAKLEWVRADGDGADGTVMPMAFGLCSAADVAAVHLASFEKAETAGER